MTGPGVGFGVLGPLQLSIDGVDVSAGTPKQRAVLAMLVINRNRAVGVDALIGAVWGESAPSAARASLHSYVSNLRKLVGGAEALASAPPGYRLAVGETDCDIGRFGMEKAAGVHAAATGDFERAGRHLSAALAQWRGPVLDDLRDFAFVEPFATALEEERLAVVIAWAEAELACGRAAAVIGELETLVAQHPYREPLWAQLITAYYLAERQSDALDAYRRLRVSLADDLGIDPGPTVQALYERVLRQQPLDAQRSAQKAAVVAETVLDQRTKVDGATSSAWLVEASGHRHPLQAVATRIGRLPDNDIVIEDGRVSRHHAAIIDTGTGWVLSDLRSANGVEVQHSRVRGSAPLTDGDQVRICDHIFTFELDASE
ncbi:BTAD domain-containing putative transcriptional regulator [Mycolicibacterium pulveris]|uniref:BTAD domain-containing putative transcriptional regulator n=1 Tax=Mycolicibacterium pulveris TaxID=36813 RepID=UPI003CE7E972